MRYTPWTTLAAALVLANAACTVDSADEAKRGNQAFAQAPAPAPNLVTITARDFAFDAPLTVPAGMTTVRLASQGREMHHAQLVRLDEGHTVDELMAGMAAGGEHGGLPAWATFVGGPNVPAPNGFNEATMNLEPGNYALICLVPSPDGVPHVMKGMVKPLTVVPRETATEARAAEADVRMVLRDYGYDIAPEITAGRRTIRVENVAAQPHEVVVMRLAPGKSAQDVIAWVHGQNGPPPAMPLTGTSLLSTGQVNQVTADFAPGEYALLCFVPDAKDGAPHVAHGMVRQLTVR
jgi:uncharacterized cupredoxin-like copper-binding protein